MIDFLWGVLGAIIGLIVAICVIMKMIEAGQPTYERRPSRLRPGERYVTPIESDEAKEAAEEFVPPERTRRKMHGSHGL